jgi:hypothetical protein
VRGGPAGGWEVEAAAELAADAEADADAGGGAVCGGGEVGGRLGTAFSTGGGSHSCTVGKSSSESESS